jgi:hypothetical protein
MINNNKLYAFALATVLYFITLCINVEYKLLITFLYVILILVGLYDIGKDELENEKAEQLK